MAWGAMHCISQRIGGLSGRYKRVNGTDAMTSRGRIAMLDGWRALSILAVLAGHWLPLGPAHWHLNGVVAACGMALFFNLSGFLITQQLSRDDRVGPFLIRRLFRILPLAWAAMLILAVATHANQATIAANLLFYANLPPAHLMEGGHPLWSLCVEVQFYLLIACIVAFGGRKALYLVPLLALGVTVFRIIDAEPISIVTWHRVDEILAGATLALAVTRIGAREWSMPFASGATLLAGLLLAASSSPDLPALNYARPYFAAATIGTSLYAAPAWMRHIWGSRPARYIAEISYALYVVHGMLTATWLGGTQATTSERYLRRPLLAGASVAIAHMSTFYYEHHWIGMGRRLIARLYSRPAIGKSAEQPL